MQIAHRLISLTTMGALALSMAPVAGAQSLGFGASSHGRGRIGLGGADLSTEVRAEMRAELRACKENNPGDREAGKACADAVFEKYGVEKPERPERPEISDDVRAELEACRENNDDREAAKACADAVFETNGIERPTRRPGRRIGQRFRSSIEETCGEREDTDTWKECASEARGSLRGEFRSQNPRAFVRNRVRVRTRGLENSSDLRAELRACLELDDREELRECVFGVRAEIRASLETE